MTKETIIAIRKRLKMDKNISLKLIIDENYFVDERTSTVVWDDDNGLLYAFCPNQERENNVACPGCMQVTSYENVVMLIGYYRSDEMKTQLDNIKTDVGNITNAAIDNTIKYIYDLSNIDMYHDAKTVEKSGAFDDKIGKTKKSDYPKEVNSEENSEG